MFHRILVAYEGSDAARAALSLAIDLARVTGAELASISVEEHLPRYAATISEVVGAKEAIDRHFRALTKEARDLAALAGVELETAVRQGHQAGEILDFARQGKFELLVLGAHGHHRLVERIIGSTSLTVARLAPCSVLIVHPRGGGTLGLGQLARIVVGLDGSPLGRLAFRTALDLAILSGAPVTGVTVHEISPLARGAGLDRSYVAQLGEAARERARAAGVEFEHAILTGHAAGALRQHASRVRADLLVLGATGLEHPWNPAIGGTASTLVAEAPCSLLLVRPPQAVLHVRDVMARAVSAVTPDTPLAEVVERLVRGDVKALPVVDERGRVAGIITGGDLLSRGDVELRLSIQRELDAETLRERLQALRRSPRTAREVMTRHVHTVGAGTDLGTAIRIMAARRVKRLPVVDEDGVLVGIVSRADVLRAIAALPAAASRERRASLAVGGTVADATVADVPVVSPEASADEVLARVLASPLRRVVVVEPDGRVVGLISDRDLLARSAGDTRSWIVRRLRGQPSASRAGILGPAGEPLTAASLVAPSLLTVRPEDSLVHAVRLMLEHRVKRLIVVDDGGRLRGLVDRREIVRLLAGERPAEPAGGAAPDRPPLSPGRA